MQVNLTEDDLRAIWRDIYVHAFNTSSHLTDIDAHRDAAQQADAAVTFLRADAANIKDFAAVTKATAADSETISTRTADDERRDAVAYLVESARCRQVTDYDSAVIAEGRHVGAAGLYGPGREVRPVSPGQPAKVAHRTAEDERRDVVAFLTQQHERAKEWATSTTLKRDRADNEAAIYRAAMTNIKEGVHVGAADRAEVKP